MTDIHQEGQIILGPQQNAGRDIHNHYQQSPWKPPLMLPPRAHTFVGREEDLAWLLQQLRLEPPIGGQVIAICGAGGIGKTALVAEALILLNAQKDFLSQFPDGIFYHSFYAYPSLEIAFEDLAHTFDRDPIGDLRRAAVRALSRRRALLIFDGVEALDSALPLHELGGENVVILLSRQQINASRHLDLGLLSHEQGITLFKKIAGSRADDHSSVAYLVQEIGGYPLALQLIGSYLVSYQENMTEYIEQFKNERLRVLQHPELHHGDHQYLSVHLVLQHTYNSLSLFEQQLLVVIGMLAPASFSIDLVHPILHQPIHEVRQALGRLVNLNLLHRPEQAYEVSHPLVHTFAVNLQVAQPAFTQIASMWQDRLLSTLATHFDHSDCYDANALALWLPHVLVMLPIGQTAHLTKSQYLTTAHIFNTAGFNAKSQGQYVQAASLYQGALTIREQQLGSDHLDTAQSLNNLAILYMTQGKYTEAELLYQRALAIFEQQLGSDHSDTATCLNDLATLYDMQGTYVKAEPLYRRALAIYEQQLGPTHPDTGACLNSLAAHYLKQGKYRKAEPVLKRALTICKQRLGATHPDSATCLNNLAELYRTQGKLAKAKPLYQQALAIYEQQLGPNHPATAQGLNNLAVLYEMQAEYTKAEPLCQRALAIREQQLGPDHPNTAQSLNNLAALYDAQGKYIQAEPLYQRTLEIREKQLGSNHPDTAQSLNNLAYLYEMQEKYDKAEPLYQRALVIREQQLGSDHPDTAQSLNNLAEIYFKQEKYTQTESLHQRALAIYLKQLGPEHHETATSLTNLAAFYTAQGNYAKAEPLFRRAYDIRERVLGSEHPATAQSVWWLAIISQHQQHFQEAKQLYQHVVSIYTRTLGREHPTTLGVCTQYDAFLQIMRQDPEQQKEEEAL